MDQVKLMGLSPIQNHRHLLNAESRQNHLPEGIQHKLVIQYQMVNLKNIYKQVKNRLNRQVVFMYLVYVNTYFIFIKYISYL